MSKSVAVASSGGAVVVGKAPASSPTTSIAYLCNINLSASICVSLKLTRDFLTPSINQSRSSGIIGQPTFPFGPVASASTFLFASVNTNHGMPKLGLSFFNRSQTAWPLSIPVSSICTMTKSVSSNKRTSSRPRNSSKISHQPHQSARNSMNTFLFSSAACL